MRFPGIRLVQQTEQKIRRFESVLKKTKRERLKSALYLRLKKRRFEICEGRFHERLLFSDLRLLLTKTQCISGITSKFRI